MTASDKRIALYIGIAGIALYFAPKLVGYITKQAGSAASAIGDALVGNDADKCAAARNADIQTDVIKYCPVATYQDWAAGVDERDGNAQVLGIPPGFKNPFGSQQRSPFYDIYGVNDI